MINVIIFSKNRPCQLELLLRSIKIFTNIKYIIADIVASGYNIYLYDNVVNYKKMIPFNKKIRLNLSWTMDSADMDSFKERLLSNINPFNSFTMFLTDDCIFFDSLDIDDACKQLDKYGDFASCFSLRLGNNITYCYPHDKEEPFSKGYFNYNMSLDGHIFRTEQIFPLIESLGFDSPNSLETQLSRNPIKGNILYYKTPKIINLAMNRVQNTHQNRCGNISAEYLNKQFANGKRIKLEPIVEMAKTANSCHVEYTPEWEDQIEWN